MTRKTNNLQAALSQTRSVKPPVEVAAPAPDAPATGAGTADTARPASRKGKVNVSAWLDPAFKRSLRMVQAVTDKKLEPLLAEALNDLFQKYDVPQIREDS